MGLSDLMYAGRLVVTYSFIHILFWPGTVRTFKLLYFIFSMFILSYFTLFKIQVILSYVYIYVCMCTCAYFPNLPWVPVSPLTAWRSSSNWLSEEGLIWWVSVVHCTPKDSRCGQDLRVTLARSPGAWDEEEGKSGVGPRAQSATTVDRDSARA